MFIESSSFSVVRREPRHGLLGATAEALGSAPIEREKVACNPALLSLSQARRVLLLQGPLGPFFDRLTQWLSRRGAQVQRVVFQGGDTLDCQRVSPQVFTGQPSEWQPFLSRLLQTQAIDHLVLFGQARFYHSVAIRVARAMGIRVVVMEEGYFRPGFATMELDGVNGYSNTLTRYEWAPNAVHENGDLLPLQGEIEPEDCERHFQKMAWHASRHYLALRREKANFPHYLHHKEANPFWYARYWVGSWAKKYWFGPGDKLVQNRLLHSRRPYFLAPLQHDGDSQITHHSSFSANTHFIIEVVRSFSQNAPRDAWLVFRQHPYSRGGPGHGRLIHALARECGIDGRVVHLVEGDTPVLVERSQGVVLINSTVGLLALQQCAPLIALGDALYDRPGLTFQDGIDRFWTESMRPDARVSAAFRTQLRQLTQVPTSLYDLADAPLNWR